MLLLEVLLKVDVVELTSTRKIVEPALFFLIVEDELVVNFGF